MFRSRKSSFPRQDMIRKQRTRTYDVAFYVPRLTPLIAPAASFPAGGAETQVFLLARALAERGCKVCLVVFDLPGIAIPSSVGDVDISVRPPYLAHERLGKLRETANIYKAISDVDARVVVSRIASPEVGVAGACAKVLGRRFVYSSSSISDFVSDTSRRAAEPPCGHSRAADTHARGKEDLDFSQLSRTRRDWRLFRLGVRLADEIVVQTEEQARLCQTHFGRSPVLIRSIAEMAPQSDRDPEAFLWIGRLVASKRPHEFVELARSLPHARFWMVAAPAMQPRAQTELMAEVARSAAAVPNLELLAPRPRRQLMELVDSAVAVVSTADFEGMPNIFLEGWARGVPALTLRHDPDGVIERHCLGACAHGSSEVLIDHALQLWKNRRNRTDFGARCRRYIYEHHSPGAVSRRWQQVLGIAREAPGPVATGTR
jgi:glycosyltransferase involved in cell wall biosynthesis